MAITAIAARGTGVSSTSSNSFTMNPSAAIVAGRVAILTVSTDNDSSATTTAASNRHNSVTDATGANTWTKLGEYTNGQGSAAAGVTVSAWLCNVAQQLNTSGTTITVSLGTAVVDKAMSLYEFSVDAGNTLEPVAGAIAYQAVNAANGFGSSALSGLPSKQYLFYRGMGKEANTTTALTVTSGFTAITNNRSRNNTAAMTVYGEFDIDTLTGVTSNPTLAVTGDTASVFVALEEYTPPVTHDASGDLTGSESSVAGSAARIGSHATTGTLVGQGAVVTGSAQRVAPTVTHATTGALTGSGGSVSGAASRTLVHATTGGLTGSAAVVVGSAARSGSTLVTHSTSGALVGLGASVNAEASGPASANSSRPGFEMVSRKVYIKRGQKIHIFDTVEDADAWEEAQQALSQATAQKPKPSSRSARKRAARRVDASIEHEVINLVELERLIRMLNMPVQLKTLEAKQDWLEVARIALLAQAQAEEERDIEMLLLA